MTYSIIGTGNIAWFLTKKLTAAGHQCNGIYGRNEEAAAILAGEVQSKAYHNLSDIIDSNTDMCFIAISDQAIERMARQLSFHNTVLLHTAGSVDMEVLAKGAHDYAVLWPVYSIIKNDITYHRNIPCAWEASSDRARRYVLSIAHAITDVLFEAKAEQRRWLHLSAVMSNNFVNHLMGICEQICTDQNLPFSVLQPIIRQTFERIATNSPHEMQTGPAFRGDQETIQQHLSILRSHADWQQVYKALSSSIENMYRTKA